MDIGWPHPDSALGYRCILLKEYDNREGWKTLYKEEVWPVVSKRFKITPTKEEEKKGDKIERKKSAKLPNRPKAPGGKSEKDEENLTEEERFSDYMARRKAQLFD